MLYMRFFSDRPKKMALGIVVVLAFSFCNATEATRLPMKTNNGKIFNVTEDDHLNLVCDASISKNDVEFQWFRNGVPMEKDGLDEGDGSEFNYKPARRDDSITCKVFVERSTVAQSSYSLDFRVFYSPKVEIKYPGKLGKYPIENKTKIYNLKCDVLSANPAPHVFQWHHNGDLIEGEEKNKLILKYPDRDDAGNYTCSAINTIGKYTSVEAPVNVKYRPVCQREEETVYFLHEGQTLNISCNVDAYPMPKNYMWRSNDSNLIIRTNALTTNYTWSNGTDDLTLRCNAIDGYGSQINPCYIHLVKGNMPSPVSDCLVNKTHDDNHMMICQAGDDGPMESNFTLEIQDMSSNETLIIVNPNSPYFVFERLEDCINYNMSVYTSNDIGVESYSFIFDTEENCGASQYDSVFQDPKVRIPVIGISIAMIILLSVGIWCYCRKSRTVEEDGLEMERERLRED